MTKNQKRTRTMRRWTRQAASRQTRIAFQNYMGMKVTALRSECKSRGLAGYSKLTKPLLVKMIMEDRFPALVA